MRHFLIYVNRRKDPELALSGRIRDFLERRGHLCTVRLAEPERKLCREAGLGGDVPPVLDNVDYVIVLGGDGTMLQAAREVKKYQTPLIGVNLGTLGYMTEIEPDHLEDALEKLAEGKFETESRMMLNGKTFLKDGRIREEWALNDIVISRSGSLRVIFFSIYVNGQFLNEYHADGMIVTTPTGSTGYNLSAGGPIVDPKARLIVLTPICPHTLNQRSIILSPEARIEIEIPPGRDGQEQTVEASFDGSHVILLRTGERICIVKSKKTTRIIPLNRVGFLEVLHKKLAE